MRGAAEDGLEIVEVFPARRSDRRRFVELPFSLAAAHAAWQPGLRRLHEDVVHPGRNPFWRTRSGSFFVAVSRGRVVGRLGLIDPGSLPDRPQAAVLAFPDFIDDAAVAASLFAAAEARARQRRARELLGPMNPDIHHDVGIQISGHDRRNAILMGFQPPYYRERFEAYGFEGVADFEAWGLDRETFIAGGRLERAVRRVERQPALRIREVDLSRFDRELELFFRLYTGAFADHWGFSAPSWDEFRFIAGDLRHILRAGMSLVAEWEGEPVGFVLGVPDLYAIVPKSTRGRLTPRFFVEMLLKWSRIDEVRVMIAGVLPAYRKHGVHLPLFYRIAHGIFDLGFRGGEISWVMADNGPMVKVLPLLGARPTKTYRLYRKQLAQ
jgi:hypothetical protein